MLTALSIRDIVLIEKLDLSLDDGLTVLTGETGAGKSILLDSLGLALGERGDAGLVRAGRRGAWSRRPSRCRGRHPARAILDEQGLDAEGDLVIRRMQNADGPSRASINDQPVSVNLLRQIGGALVEIHGQHADRALVDVAAHRRLLDAFGGHEAQVNAVAARGHGLSRRGGAHRAPRLMARAEAERDYLEHAAEELRALNPMPARKRNSPRRAS